MNNRQIVFTAQGQVQLLNSPMDHAPLKADEVAGSTLASMISPGTEIQGQLFGDQFPVYSGYSCVFEVQQIGSEVSKIKVGDRVFAMGSHCSYQQHSQQSVLVVPASLDASRACFARLMGVSMSTLSTTVSRPPSNVLVVGLGLIGNLASRIFDSCGYRVTAVDPVADRREQLALNSHCIVASSVPVIQDMDIAIDCSGHEQAVLDACGALRTGGEMVLIGVPWRRRTDLCAWELLSVVFHRYVHLRSGWEWEVPHYRGPFDRASIWENLAGALRWLDEKRLCVDGLHDICKPDLCQEAYDRLAKQGNGPLTTVFDWQ